MITKTCSALIKAVGDDPGAGEFEALVSVFGNVDAYGDRVMPGAFAKSLEAWRSRGDPIPVTWSHDWSLDGFIGSADPADVTETDAGLVVKGRLDLTDPGGAKAYRLLKNRLVRNFSFSYDVTGSSRTKDALELTELDLFEFGPCLVGANRETDLLGIKAGVDPTVKPTEPREIPSVLAHAKAGRVLSAANEAVLRGLAEGLEAIGDLAEALGEKLEAVLGQVDPSAPIDPEEAAEGVEPPIDPASLQRDISEALAALGG